MAASVINSNKHVRRMESKKSYSWWWDSHVSPKNSKWLAENLETMDQSVKRMLKLIEEDGDSFAKKAEMYYQKRPELISHVEEFYRMYRSLAERYDHVTGELRKNLPSDLQSQGSGISDFGSELPSTWPSPDPKISRRRSGHRAAGFEFFLGAGGNSSEFYQKEGDESSTLTDSESESDDSSVNNYSGLLGTTGDQGLSRKIMELEIELREAKEKLRMQQEENAEGSSRGRKHDNVPEDLIARVAGYERELRVANQKLRLAEEEIIKLSIEVQRDRSLESTTFPAGPEFESIQEDVKMGGEPQLQLETSEFEERISGLDEEVMESLSKSLVEELRITKARLEDSEKQIATLRHESNISSERIHQLQDQLASAQNEAATWKSRFNTGKRDATKLQERLARLKTSLTDRDHEIRDLKLAVSDAEENIFPEKSQLKAEMSRLLEEQTHLGELVREWECPEIQQLKADITERDDLIKSMDISLSELKSKRDDLNTKVSALKSEVSSRDDRIDLLDKHLNQLHMEQAELIAGMQGAHKQVEELKSRTIELKEEVERQRDMILEGAEEKREVIRQLCFSLDHYRNGYYRLRKAFVSHKRVPVYAS
ncbi:Protein NETWORKED 4A [Quillaja saponaria]|uniref:Protein NETWORKED 4A n=1 Tax=Quillaja saponaria TaxID=32244 RepID=A0AAD7KKW8_QUISA|nr:Protein NETWORKED 4A [Quillaja saponaria]